MSSTTLSFVAMPLITDSATAKNRYVISRIGTLSVR